MSIRFGIGNASPTLEKSRTAPFVPLAIMSIRPSLKARPPLKTQQTRTAFDQGPVVRLSIRAIRKNAPPAKPQNLPNRKICQSGISARNVNANLNHSESRDDEIVFSDGIIRTARASDWPTIPTSQPFPHGTECLVTKSRFPLSDRQPSNYTEVVQLVKPSPRLQNPPYSQPACRTLGRPHWCCQ